MRALTRYDYPSILRNLAGAAWRSITQPQGHIRKPPVSDGRWLKANRVFPMQPLPSSRLEVPAGGLHGLCPVCGHGAVFDGFTDNERESGPCSICNCMNRQRQVALVAKALLQIKAAWDFPPHFRVYNTEAAGALHRALQAAPGYVCSEYFGPGHRSGSQVNGIRHEDLRALSFEDGSIDLMLSSDVLEHVPRPYEAHREIFRVLRKGGRHIFTVPFYPWEALDDVRAVEGDPIEFLAEPLYHGDPVRPDEGVLVWTIFGLQMIVELGKIGFQVSYWNLHEPAHGIIGPWSIVFDAYKP